MKIFVAGATGVIGRSLLPMLIKNGHIVFAMIRNTSQVEAMKKVGAIPVIADVFNRKAVFSVLEETNPDVVIHQLTSLSLWDFEDNAKIRTKGTRNLVDAAKNVGVQKFHGRMNQGIHLRLKKTHYILLLLCLGKSLLMAY